MKRLLFLGLICILAVACITQTSVSSVPTVAPTAIASEHTTVEVDEVSVPVTELIVTSAEDMPDLDALAEMTSLRLIDLTALSDTPFSEIEQIWLKRPDCQIIWNQKLTDGVFRSDSTELTLPNATLEDIHLLSAFSDLIRVDATGSTEYEALYAYQTAHPSIEVHYALKLGDRSYSEQDDAIQVPGDVDPETLVRDLHAFPNIREIDLLKSGWDSAEIESLKAAFPSMHVLCYVQMKDSAIRSDTEILDLREFTQLTADDLIERLSHFTALKTVALPSDWTEDEAAKIKAAFSDVELIGTFEAFGRTVDGGAEELDLSKVAIGSTDEVESLLKKTPFLKKLILCECGLTNEQMESLCNAHPEIKFVWTVEIGKRKLRTDAIGFSTKNPSKYTNPNSSAKYNESVKKAVRLYEGDIDVLKYCTDLEALDLGHNYLTNNDLAVISGLTKLKILILADNKITDISALSTLKDLEYIELFMNKVPDLSPLSELTNLRDVNVCNMNVSDLTPLFALTNAKRLWYAMNPFNREQAKALKDALPDCVCNFTTRNETAEGWREDARYQWMRSYFQDD